MHSIKQTLFIGVDDAGVDPDEKDDLEAAAKDQQAPDVGHEEDGHGDPHDALGMVQDILVVHNLEGVVPSCLDASFLAPCAEAAVSSSLMMVVPSSAA